MNIKIFFILILATATFTVQSQTNNPYSLYTQTIFFEYSNGKIRSIEALIISPNGHLVVNDFLINDHKKIYTIDADNNETQNIIFIANDDSTGIAILKTEKNSTNYYNLSETISDKNPNNLYVKLPNKDTITAKFIKTDCIKFRESDIFTSSFSHEKSFIKCGEIINVFFDNDGNRYKFINENNNFMSDIQNGIIRNDQNFPLGIVQSAFLSNSSIILSYISLNDISNVTERIIKTGKMKRPRLYIGLKNKNNVPIVEIIKPNSPVFKAGLLPGDHIVSINEFPLNKPEDLPKILDNFQPGNNVTISIERNGIIIKIDVVLD
ncbi:PDZ domain-containing protein [Leptospira bourretii]|uniref:PDZ domain-containing protein n=2 Tax=Leptospira bourretii TaxID=2484962 RepID=A0ABY2LGY9_9LEPT|nr:PDZ domain-containing protein [Leptospira bourretii]TGK92235.1 PDZ domain-containing protein [Leptospira bourretii]